MALIAIHKYRNLDSTADFNARFAKLFSKGFYDGGDIVAVPSQLKIQIQAFKAISFDGMIVYDNSPVQLNLIAGQLNYVVLRAIYQLNADPILKWEVLDAAAYAGDPNFDDLILRCVVNIPSGSTAVTSSMINQTQADMLDKISRFVVRGTITSQSLLPTVDSRVGDSYVVSDGTGDTPNIFVWNGLSWVNVTTASVVLSELMNHRQNLYPDEIHLTNDQADALIGTYGVPSLTNPFVTTTDPRVPSLDENDALGGISNTIYNPNVILPNSTNRFVTLSREFAVPTEKIYSVAQGGVVSIDVATEGPIWVGLGSDDKSAFPNFNLYNQDPLIDQEYINSTGKVPKITGLYVGNTKLVPNSVVTYPPLGTTPSGFLYAGTLNIVLDNSLFRSFNDINVDPVGDLIEIPGHSLTSNKRVRVGGVGNLPTGLTRNTDYFVIVVDVDHIQLSLSSGGSAVNIISQGSGQFTLYDEVGTDTGFRLSYGKLQNLGQIPPDVWVRRKPSDAQKDAQIGVVASIQQFNISTVQDTINLNPSKFEMYVDDAILDVDVFENGVKLMPNDNTFKPITIQAGINDKIDFIDSTSTSYSVTLNPGTYSTSAQLQILANDIALKMDTASADSFTCSYSPSQFKYTIQGSGNFSLLWNTGLNRNTNCAEELGFNKVDQSGSATYTGQKMINRGYVGWYKVSATQIKLVNAAQPNGVITVQKNIGFKF